MSKYIEKYNCKVDEDDYLNVDTADYKSNGDIYFEIFNVVDGEEINCAACLTRKQVVEMIAKLQSTIYD